MTVTVDPLAHFLGSIGNLAGDEARKAKVLYVRNALAEYRGHLDDADAERWLHMLLGLTLFLLPFVYVIRRNAIAQSRTRRQQIENALDVWASELGADADPVRRELAQLSAHEPQLLPWKKPAPQLGA